MTYYNDIDAYCCKVLRANIQQGRLPKGLVDERDIKQLHATDFMGHNHVHLFCGIGGFPLGLQWANFPESLRVLTGGFPCQNISKAGDGSGLEGAKSGLWSEMYRLVQEAIDCNGRFDYILIENVSALTGRGLSTVLANLATAGYDAEWFCLRASDVGASHERDRIFIVAYTCRSRRRQRHASTVTAQPRYPSRRTHATRVQGKLKPLLGRVFDGLSRGLDRYQWPAGLGEQQYEWEAPRVITDKLPYRTKRIEALGNAIVPQLIAVIGQHILEREQL